MFTYLLLDAVHCVAICFYIYVIFILTFNLFLYLRILFNI